MELPIDDKLPKIVIYKYNINVLKQSLDEFESENYDTISKKQMLNKFKANQIEYNNINVKPKTKKRPYIKKTKIEDNTIKVEPINE